MKNRARNPKLKTNGARNVLRLDPTRTTMLRKAAIADVRRRFARLKLALDTLIVKEDSFGLRERRRVDPFATNAFCPTGEGGGVDPSCGGSSSSLGKSRSNDRRKTHEKRMAVSEWREHLWNRGTVTSISKKTVPGGEYEEFHPGEIVVYRGVSRGGRKRGGRSWTKSRSVAEKYADGGKVETRRLTKNDPALDINKFLSGIPSKSASDREVFVANSSDLAINERWELKTSPERLALFQEWLAKQLKWYVIGLTQEQLWARYVAEGFAKGAGRAFDDVRSRRGTSLRSSDYLVGERQQFLATSFRRPETVEKVKLLASRTFEEMVNVGEEVKLRLGRVLADGLVQGRNPRDIARTMSEQLAMPMRRAETIARTEIIRAHSEGQLNAMEDLGVDEVGVMVEWSTAGDDRVCEACAPMEGVVLKLEEAHGMIPRHPNCRCSFIPANVGESRKEQVRGKTKIERQIDLSARLAGDTFDVGIEIDKNRPRALVSPTKNAFCPTGPGGGQDNSCSSREDGRDQSSSDLSYDPKYSLPKEGGYVRAKRGNVEYHVNPSKVELGKLLTSSHGHVRGLADGERVVVWDANKALHKELSDAIGGTGVSAFKLERAAGMEDGTLFLTHHPISISDTRGDHWKRDWPDHHPYFKRLGSKTEDDDTASYMKLNVFVLHAFCPTGPGGGVDPTCSPSAGEGGGPTSAPLRYKDHKGTNHEHNAEIVKTSKVKVIAPEKYKKDVTEALAHVLESKFLSKQMEGVTVEVTSLGNRHGNMSKHLYVSQESLEQHGPGFMATIVRHELEHKILTSQGVPSSKQESRVRHTAGTWAAIKYGSMATTNPRAAEGFKKAAIEQGVKVL